jgi:hypothetical protein
MKRLIIVLLLISALLFPAFSAGADASYSGKVMLYSSTGEDVVIALKNAFQAKFRMSNWITIPPLPASASQNSRRNSSPSP